MAWEQFWKPGPDGRRVTTSPQLAAFRTHFAERVVEPKPEIGRPLVIVLEKPFKLTWLRTGEGFEQSPVLLRDLQGWPPKLSLSKFGHLPRKGQGDLVDARVVLPERPGAAPTLLIRGDFDDQEASCAIGDYPAVFLECVALTLNQHPGEPFQSLSDLEVAGVD